MLNIFLVNAQNIVVCSLLIGFILKSDIPIKKVPILGLFLISMAGILGVASVEYAFPFFESITNNATYARYIIVNLFGLLDTLGICCLVYSLLRCHIGWR